MNTFGTHLVMNLLRDCVVVIIIIIVITTGAITIGVVGVVGATVVEYVSKSV